VFQTKVPRFAYTELLFERLATQIQLNIQESADARKSLQAAPLKEGYSIYTLRNSVFTPRCFGNATSRSAGWCRATTNAPPPCGPWRRRGGADLTRTGKPAK
jgi:hypothetical protein